MSAWFVDDGGAELVVVLFEPLQPLGQRSAPQIGTAGDDEPGWFAGSVGILAIFLGNSGVCK